MADGQGDHLLVAGKRVGTEGVHGKDGENGIVGGNWN